MKYLCEAMDVSPTFLNTLNHFIHFYSLDRSLSVEAPNIFIEANVVLVEEITHLSGSPAKLNTDK